MGTFLRLRRWDVLRSWRPSLSVSKSRPLVWPSLWQVLQLYHWLMRALGVVEDDLAAAHERQRLGPAQRNRLDELGRLGIDDLDGVGQIIRDVERLAVGGKGQLGGPAAQLDAAVPAVFLEQLGRDQVARAVGPPGERLQVGPEDHHLVRAAATDRHELLVAADGDAVGIAGGLALRVERERGVGRPSRRAGLASGAGRAPSPGRCCSGSSANRAIPHVGDVAGLAVGADRDLPQVVAVDRDGARDLPGLRRR